MSLLESIRTLCGIYAPSCHEETMIRYLQTFSHLTDGFTQDEMGNLLFRQRSLHSEKTLLLDAHMDQAYPGDNIPLRTLRTHHGLTKMIGTAFDDRLGVACLLEVMKIFSVERPPVNLLYAFTVQEEIGFLGARKLASSLTPPLTCLVVDTPPVGKTCLGKGVSISRTVGEEMLEGVKFQKEQMETTYDCCNAGVYSELFPTVYFGPPVHGLHSKTSNAVLEDVEETIKLIQRYIVSI